MSARWYFAFIDEGEAFNAVTHARVDTELLGFTLDHQEGQFATLQVVTRNPLGLDGTFALGLLGAGRKQWCLFSVSFDGAPAVLLFRGRIVALPTDVFGAKVTIDFQARPVDFTDQKRAIADGIRAAGPPVWCPEFYDEQQREDIELVLESGTAVWFIDPVTHVVSLSDVLIGEGDALSFGLSEHRFDSMKLSLSGVPTPAVDVDIEFNWTQRASGDIQFLLTSQSYTITGDSYPKAGASFGDGWTVQTANVTQSHDFAVKSIQESKTINITWWDGAKSTLNIQGSDDRVAGPGTVLSAIKTNENSASQYSDDSPPVLTSWSHSVEFSDGLVPLYSVSGTYTVNYDAARPMIERVTYTLRADVQATIVPPDDTDAPRLDFKSVDLSELLDGEAPIGDPRRRSYATQSRGEDSIFYSLLCATAKLKRDARVAEIEFSPFLDRLLDLRLDKNAIVYDWRLPGGSATGKITRYTLRVSPPSDGGAGSYSLTVAMGCAVGRGGVLVEEGGEPDYVEDDYVEEGDAYQERTGEVILFDDEVGFTPPPFAPNDDGLNFLSTDDPITRAIAMFEIPPTTDVTLQQQADAVADASGASLNLAGALTGLPPPGGFETWPEAMQDAVQKRAESIQAALEAVNMRLVFKLKDMRAKFETPIELEVQDPKIPRMIDFEFEE